MDTVHFIDSMRLHLRVEIKKTSELDSVELEERRTGEVGENWENARSKEQGSASK